MAAARKGDAAEEPNLGAHHRREDQGLSLGSVQASVGGPSKRTKKLMDAPRAPTKISEVADSGRKLSLLRRTGLGLPCVRSVPRCWGIICDLSMIPHFPPTELAVLRWSPSFSEGRNMGGRPKQGGSDGASRYDEHLGCGASGEASPRLVAVAQLVVSA